MENTCGQAGDQEKARMKLGYHLPCEQFSKMRQVRDATPKIPSKCTIASSDMHRTQQQQRSTQSEEEATSHHEEEETTMNLAEEDDTIADGVDRKG
ncbi:hypothetical protein SEMRO_336_G120310.1 [Seminavis robusta]|uniref:Uncharacterized protein n=1 Tax=Seminavis robusta TaxID=568900 RepID=A0A9N8DTQ9_9STRA|nr:hypothetical protein SEMRO_336_G120310.1 [Seminavis robusta]|eukprot:Sro336_g120310.1 n/a (96) ;mRNA; f:27971-28258